MSPVNCTVTYTVKCSHCMAIDQSSYTVRKAETVPSPGIPTGWQEVGGKLFCELHVVYVKYTVLDK